MNRKWADELYNATIGETALVTGGAGFIGSHIVEGLIDCTQMKRIIVVDNLVAGKLENIEPWIDTGRIEFHNVDVADYASFAPLFKGVDYVFHEAASKCTVCLKDPMRDLMTNTVGAMNVMMAANEYHVRKVVAASTGSVMSGSPMSLYGTSKHAGENYLRVMNKLGKYSLRILRYYNVFGPRQDFSDVGGVIPIFVKRVYTGQPIMIYGDGMQTRHFTFVKDVVQANLGELYTQGHIETRTIVPVINEINVCILHLARYIHDILGVQHNIKFADAREGDIKQFDVYQDSWSHNVEGLRKFRVDLAATVMWYADKFDSMPEMRERKAYEDVVEIDEEPARVPISPKPSPPKKQPTSTKPYEMKLVPRKAKRRPIKSA